MNDPTTDLLERPTRGPHRNAYDPENPPALLEFMRRDWAAPAGAPASPIEGSAFHRARRRALSAAFPGEFLVVPTGAEKVRANDTFYRFRPGSDFYYLTGDLEPDCVLVLEPLPEGGHRDVLLVEPALGKAHDSFFTDRLRGELWVGPRLGTARSRERFAVDQAHGLPGLASELELCAAAEQGWRAIRGIDPAVDAALAEQPERDAEFATALSEMRLIKDAFEIAQLERAVAATARAFDDVAKALNGLSHEREVEGIFGLRARTDGNDIGYLTIAAAGAHSCTLHWTRNDGPLKAGDLLLLDAGVEAATLYTADVTRTLSIGGTFSEPQRAIYSLVLEAQRAALAECKPGNDFLDPNRAAMRVIAHGLERLRILPMTAEDALREEHQFYRRYSLHGVSHMLGIDVHDCAAARAENYRYGKLRPGMVLTVEPGLYFQTDDLTVPVEYRGIGVRIEDDVAITNSGHRVLSAAIPSEVADVERWVR